MFWGIHNRSSRQSLFPPLPWADYIHRDYSLARDDDGDFEAYPSSPKSSTSLTEDLTNSCLHPGLVIPAKFYNQPIIVTVLDDLLASMSILQSIIGL